MKCPKCGGELERVEPGYYTCDTCLADYQRVKGQLISLSGEDEYPDADDEIVSAQDHFPDDNNI